jgi:hypothetical protein
MGKVERLAVCPADLEIDHDDLGTGHGVRGEEGSGSSHQTCSDNDDLWLMHHVVILPIYVSAFCALVAYTAT